MAELHNAGVWPLDQQFPAQNQADDNINFKKSRDTPKTGLRAALLTPETSQTSLYSIFTVAIDDPAVPVTSAEGLSQNTHNVLHGRAAHPGEPLTMPRPHQNYDSTRQYSTAQNSN